MVLAYLPAPLLLLAKKSTGIPVKTVLKIYLTKRY